MQSIFSFLQVESLINFCINEKEKSDSICRKKEKKILHWSFSTKNGMQRDLKFIGNTENRISL